MADQNEGRAFGWEDRIEKESEFILLPPGDYDFTIGGFERGYHNGSDKMPACNKAIIDVRIVDPASGDTVTIKHNLFLHSKSEWKLSEFFISLGLKKPGEPLTMCWNRISGCRGRCKVGNREYNGKDYNEIKKFYDPAEQPTQSGGYKAGTF